MINANELRIGNCISFKGMWNGEVEKFTSASVTIKGNEGVFDIESFQPIPLHRVTLEKIGMKLFGDGKSWVLNNRLLDYASCRDVFVDKPTLVDMVSVHQYQNFYFALTGTEIEVKL